MIGDLLSRLDGLRDTGSGTWSAKCPAHQDRSPSLSVRELDDGRVLAHCHAGCSIEEVLGALGLEWDSLFPPHPIESAKGLRRPFIPAQVFDILRDETGVVYVIAADMQKDKAIPPADFERLGLCVERLHDIARSCYGR